MSVCGTVNSQIVPHTVPNNLEMSAVGGRCVERIECMRTGLTLGRNRRWSVSSSSPRQLQPAAGDRCSTAVNSRQHDHDHDQHCHTVRATTSTPDLPSPTYMSPRGRAVQYINILYRVIAHAPSAGWSARGDRNSFSRTFHLSCSAQIEKD